MSTSRSAAVIAEPEINTTYHQAALNLDDNLMAQPVLQKADIATKKQPTHHSESVSTLSDNFLSFSQAPDNLGQIPFTPGSTSQSGDVLPPQSNTNLHSGASHPSSRDHKDGSRASNLKTKPLDTQATHLPPAAAIRKTSPGLAARLKALGFGSVNSKSASLNTAPAVDRVGRLNEDQLRQLDEKHQAGSLSPTVSRRGRPWKGTFGLSDSRTAEAEQQSASVQSVPESLCLPEIIAPKPLDMDTQKYRLPDHTNGNGTKVTLDTRREHLERAAIPLSLNEVTTPPPPPPPKDIRPALMTPPTNTPADTDYVPGLSSYFTSTKNRPGSIYTLSRASFANQLAQLTSLQLPDAANLSGKIAALPNAPIAAKALINAAEQINIWISKASEVINGLDSEDDVEWAAAGGREGLDEVEDAINRFEDLINVYVGAIEGLQARRDITSVPAEDLQRAVRQMDFIVNEWAKIRKTLHSVRAEVEIAMEWEELWNSVLGDIQGEMDTLSRLVFEMEERRHKGASDGPGTDGVDNGDLDNMGEDSPSQGSRSHASSRFTVPSIPILPSSPGISTLSPDDSSILALFARMQPLRASLDFLPMRLSGFQHRAKAIFPTACEELEMRRTGLDGTYKKLEKDAEVLRKELGEDRWVVVFRGAGRQAQKMHESVERSLLKLREALDNDIHLTSQPALAKKMENYDGKKTHYSPAIERVLSIIDKGIKDRLTVNGEVLRLHSDLQRRWSSLKEQMYEMDVIIDEVHADRKGQHLRDSISSMLSNDRSTLGSGQETPTSSPPSSVILNTLGLEPSTPASSASKARSLSANRGNQNSANRYSSIPTPNTHFAKKLGGSRLSTIPSSSTTMHVPQSSSALHKKPAWNSVVHPNSADTGHNFKPLNMTTPSPYAKNRNSPAVKSSSSSLTPSSASKALKASFLRSPVGRATSEPPGATPSTKSRSGLAFRDRMAGSPGPYAQQNLKSHLHASSPQDPNRRSSFQPSAAASAVEEGSQDSRPNSSLETSSRRSSFLPPKRLVKAPPKPDPKDNRPKWRP